jgi:hypothetical protein
MHQRARPSVAGVLQLMLPGGPAAGTAAGSVVARPEVLLLAYPAAPARALSARARPPALLQPQPRLTHLHGGPGQGAAGQRQLNRSISHAMSSCSGRGSSRLGAAGEGAEEAEEEEDREAEEVAAALGLPPAREIDYWHSGSTAGLRHRGGRKATARSTSQKHRQVSSDDESSSDGGRTFSGDVARPAGAADARAEHAPAPASVPAAAGPQSALQPQGGLTDAPAARASAAGGGGAHALHVLVASTTAAAAWRGKVQRRRGQGRDAATSGPLGGPAAAGTAASGEEGDGDVVVQRVPWHHLALDVWTLVDGFLPMYKPNGSWRLL